MDDGKIVIVLKKPFEYEGQKIEKLELDFGSFRGRDMEDIMTQYREAGGFSPAPTTDPMFIRLVAQHVSKYPEELFLDLPAHLYLLVVQRVANFLNSSLMGG